MLPFEIDMKLEEPSEDELFSINEKNNCDERCPRGGETGKEKLLKH